ncbi:MAG: AsmA family protein [Chlamydiota bacterium]
MKKFFKIFFGIVFFLVILALGAVFYLFVYFDDIIKNRAEDLVPRMTQAEFTIEKVQTSPLDGRVEISDLYLGNPEGFPEGHALKFDRILVHVDWKSLQSDKVIINSFILDGLDVFLYKEGDNKSNLRVILENIDNYIQEFNKSLELSDTKDKEVVSKKPKQKLRFQIDLFELNNIRVLAHQKKALATEAEVTIPQARLENMGENGEGLTPETLVKDILKEVMKEVDLAVKVKRAEKQGEEGEKDSEKSKGLSGKLQKLFKPKATESN